MAWRARPSRPATYLLIFVLVFGLFVTVVAPKLSAWGRAHRQGDVYSDPSLNDPDE